MLKPVYFAFVKTMLEFFLQTTHFVKSRAHSPTSKIIAMIALRRAILMKANPVVSLHAHRLFSGRACSRKKDPCFSALFYNYLRLLLLHGKERSQHKDIVVTLDYEWSPFFLRDSRASETRARVKITPREKGGKGGFLAWGDFHARSRFARSTIPEEKWGLLVESN